MKMTFRWYGEGRDPISLKKIKQIPGMSGLMGVLDEKAAGEVWTYEECKAYVDRSTASSGQFIKKQEKHRLLVPLQLP